MCKYLSSFSLRAFCYLALLSTCSGGMVACAHIGIYDDPQLTKRTDFKYYDAVPCLLVAEVKGSPSSVKVDLISLPDLDHPHYVHYHLGIGTVKMSFGLSNGVLTSFGQDVDTKVPETITAVGGLLSDVAGALPKVGIQSRDEGDGKTATVGDVKKLIEASKKDSKPGETHWALYRITTEGGRFKAERIPIID